MRKFILASYSFFEKKPFRLGIVSVLLLGICTYFALGLKMNENIGRLIPHSPKIDRYQEVFNQSKFKDKMMLFIHLTDTQAVDPDLLIQAANTLTDSLNQATYRPFIQNISSAASATEMEEVYACMYRHLPLFLDDSNYRQIAQMLQDSIIDQKLNQLLRTLVSPAGFGIKKYLLGDPLGLTAMALNKLKSFNLDDNYEVYQDFIISKDHKTLLLFISPQNSSSESASNELFITQLDNSIQQIETSYQSRIRMGYYGALASAVSNARQIKSDTRFTTLLALGLILLLFLFYFRSIRSSLVLFVPVLFGAVFTYAVIALLFKEVSAIAFGLGSVLLGISVDYSIFIFVHHKKHAHIRSTLSDLTGPILIGSTTTAVGFICLLVLHSDGLKDLALYGTLYTIASSLFSLLLLPHLIRKKNSLPPLVEKLSLEQGKAGSWYQHPLLTYTVVALSLVAFWFMPRVGFEEDLNHMNFLSPKLASYEAYMEKINSGVLKSAYVITSGSSMEEALQYSEAQTSSLNILKNNHIIRKYSGVSNLIFSQALQQAKIQQWDEFWTGERKQYVRQTLIKTGKKYHFTEDAFAPCIQQIEQAYRPEPDSAFQALQSVFLKDWITKKSGMTTLVTLIRLAPNQLDKLHDSFENNPHAIVVDKEYLTKMFIRLIKNGFQILFWISSAAVFLLLLLYFGRIELAFICFFPMMIAWIWVFGWMGLLGERFNLFNISMIIFIFGVGVDYSIFILQGMLKEYRTAQPQLNSYRSSVHIAALTTLIGLGVLIFAKHPALTSIATLSLLGIISVVILSNIFIPLMFRWLIYHKKGLRTAPVSLYKMLYALFCYSYYIVTCLLSLLLGNLLKLIPLPGKDKRFFLHYFIYISSKSTMYLMYMVKKDFIDFHKLNFNRPSVIVCNHQSHIDIP